MTNTATLSKSELLRQIQQTWDAFSAYLNSLSDEQLSEPTDPAGWTAKDHVTHLAVWMDGVSGVMEGQSRRERMGLPQEVWDRWDYDEINDHIQKRHRHLSAAEVRQMIGDAQAQLTANIERFSDEALHRPFRSYQPDSKRTDALIDAIIGNTVEHVPEHQGYMAIIITRAELEAIDPSKITVDQLLTRIQVTWDDLNRFLADLSAEQLTGLTDAGGWTVKDHVIHLAVWEDGIRALLQHQSRPEAMGIDEALWNSSPSSDDLNVVIHRRYRDMPLDEVMAVFHAKHQQLIDTLRGLSDEDLQRPYRYYAPDTDREAPVLNWIAGNTFGHYEEHKPWMQAIAEQ